MSAQSRRLLGADRLKRRRDFKAASARGRRTVGVDFVLLVAAAGDSAAPGPRLGVTVSRRVGSAVVRNHVKRCVREWFRHQRQSLPAGDVVVIARRGAARLSCPDIARRLDELAAGKGSAVQ